MDLAGDLYSHSLLVRAPIHGAAALVLLAFGLGWIVLQVVRSPDAQPPLGGLQGLWAGFVLIAAGGLLWRHFLAPLPPRDLLLGAGSWGALMAVIWWMALRRAGRGDDEPETSPSSLRRRLSARKPAAQKSAGKGADNSLVGPAEVILGALAGFWLGAAEITGFMTLGALLWFPWLFLWARLRRERGGFSLTPLLALMLLFYALWQAASPLEFGL
ncbi:hypothetical protein [Radicibacter daui]|uniref:hypothetical protein n=1 Tax=Radicibacter daui TaxID=3064829 RepID=UPI004046EC3B